MIRYVIKRLLQIIPVVLIVAILIFAIMWMCPGDPAETIAGAGATADEIEAIRENMGLNRPFIVQLGEYLYNMFLKLDLGTSYINGKSVWVEMKTRIPRTLLLASMCICGEIVIGMPLGIAAAKHQNGIIDRICMVIAMLGVSVPTFWIALELVVLFTLNLKLLPGYGIGSWQNWILPVVSNIFVGVAMEARQTRAAVLDCIRSDYVKTARAKGLSERRIMWKYILPNALIPVIQIIGMSFGRSLGGTVVIENVFSFPGIGTYITQGIANRDYPIIRGSVVFLSVWFCLIMLLADLVIGFVDPRIKAQYERQGARVKKPS